MPTYYDLICEFCNKPFKRSARLMAAAKCKKSKNTFCSQKCFIESSKVQILIPCKNCGTVLSKYPRELEKSKSGNVFCNRSCAATYNNKNKSYGTRRSKLEAYIEEQLRKDFSNLQLICNGKEAIGSELDFYFPELKLAIELNGIFHYEPIYGQEKFEKIQDNDKQKTRICLEQGVELCIINTTGCKRFTPKSGERYYNIVKSLVTSLLKRAENTNVPVS